MPKMVCIQGEPIDLHQKYVVKSNASGVLRYEPLGARQRCNGYDDEIIYSGQSRLTRSGREAVLNFKKVEGHQNISFSAICTAPASSKLQRFLSESEHVEFREDKDALQMIICRPTGAIAVQLPYQKS